MAFFICLFFVDENDFMFTMQENIFYCSLLFLYKPNLWFFIEYEFNLTTNYFENIYIAYCTVIDRQIKIVKWNRMKGQFFYEFNIYKVWIINTEQKQTDTRLIYRNVINDVSKWTDFIFREQIILLIQLR